MAKYVSKRVEVTAHQYNGSNGADIAREVSAVRMGGSGKLLCTMPNVAGVVADPGDYIVDNGPGDAYPVKPDVFERKYEPVDA